MLPTSSVPIWKAQKLISEAVKRLSLPWTLLFQPPVLFLPDRQPRSRGAYEDTTRKFPYFGIATPGPTLLFI
jgi:hypothetical protein